MVISFDSSLDNQFHEYLPRLPLGISSITANGPDSAMLTTLVQPTSQSISPSSTSSLVSTTRLNSWSSSYFTSVTINPFTSPIGPADPFAASPHAGLHAFLI